MTKSQIESLKDLYEDEQGMVDYDSLNDELDTVEENQYKEGRE